MKSCPALSFVVPCCNEEEGLAKTARTLSEKISDLVKSGTISRDSAIYFVDDGSTDRTWDLIETLASSSPVFHGIKLSANRGHQNALLAGLLNIPGDVLISMDADLQDEVGAVDRMLERYFEGNQIVYAVRSSRARDTFFKRHSAQIYYHLLRVFGTDLVFNHADYRLMGRPAVEALRQHNEVHLFLRGLIPTLGFTSTTVQYERLERSAGKSKYPLLKMLGFAWEGITSFSSIPLRAITLLGLLASFLSFMLILWVLYVRFLTADAVPGWASITIPLVFLGGVQLVSLGVIGEYIAKIYMETKARPRFIIEKKV